MAKNGRSSGPQKSMANMMGSMFGGRETGGGCGQARDRRKTSSLGERGPLLRVQCVSAAGSIWMSSSRRVTCGWTHFMDI
jgi:hypothetical protein